MSPIKEVFKKASTAGGTKENVISAYKAYQKAKEWQREVEKKVSKLGNVSEQEKLKAYPEWRGSMCVVWSYGMAMNEIYWRMKGIEVWEKQDPRYLYSEKEVEQEVESWTTNNK